jgi:serine/threonine-protein kinase RsbW
MNLNPDEARVVASPADRDVPHSRHLRGAVNFLTCSQPACYTSVTVCYWIVSSQTAIPRRKGRAFVTEQTTRLVLPSHIEAVADAAAAAADFARSCGLADEAAFGIDMAVREAITNAIVHGNKEDDTKKVELTFNCSQRAVEIEVTDQGEGFDPASIPDPTTPENILKTSGRGNFLIRNFMDEVKWLRRSEGGTTVRMVKRI